MRPKTLISTLLVSLHLLSGTAGADSGGGGWTWPVRGPVITGYRNGSDPYAAGQHRGVDIASPAGTRAVAATGGTVTFVGVVGSSGLTVSERTADGRFDVSYLHLQSAAVRRGDSVGSGDAVGAVGTSGRRSAEAPHLHFGVREAGSRTAYRDPLDFLAPPPAGGAPDPSPAPVPVADPIPAGPAPAEPAQAEPASPPLPALPVAVPSAPPAPGLTPAGLASVLARHPAATPGTPSLHLDRTTQPSIGRAHPVALQAPLLESPHRHARHERARAPRAPPGPAASGAPTRAGAGPRGAHGPSKHSGINVGWLAACIGLIATATALGHPDGTRRLTARGRARIGAVLRTASRGS